LKRQSVKGLLSAVLKESHSDKGIGTGTGTDKGTGAKKVAVAGAGRESEAVRVKVRRSETKQDPVSPGGTAVMEESVISVHNTSSSSNSSSRSRGRNEVRRSRTKKEAEIGDEVEEDEDGEDGEDREEDQDEWSDGNNSEYVEEEGSEEDEDGKHNGKKRHEEDSLESEDEGESESSEEEGKVGMKKKKKNKKKDTMMRSKSCIKRKICQVDTDTALRPCTSIGKGGSGSLSFPAVMTPEILLDLVLPRGMEYVLAPTTKGRMDGAEKGMVRVRDDVERDDPVLQQLHSLICGDLLYIHPV
jgi:cobalamin biosynthesis protein CobT